MMSSRARTLSRRSLLMAVLGGSAAGLLAACQGQATLPTATAPAGKAPTSVGTSASIPQASATTPAPASVTVSVWLQDWTVVNGIAVTQTIINDKLIPAFLKTHPGIRKVDIQYLPWRSPFFSKYATAVASKTLPDIFEGAAASMDEYMVGKVVRPLDAYLARSTLIRRADFIPSALDACTYEGKVYAIPFRIDSPGCTASRSTRTRG